MDKTLEANMLLFYIRIITNSPRDKVYVKLKALAIGDFRFPNLFSAVFLISPMDMKCQHGFMVGI